MAWVLEIARTHQARDVQVKQVLVDRREDNAAAAEGPLRVVPAVSGKIVVEIHFGDRHVGARGAVDE
jgi:hypothetical protein